MISSLGFITNVPFRPIEILWCDNNQWNCRFEFVRIKVLFIADIMKFMTRFQLIGEGFNFSSKQQTT
jgi:hypothetical protein